MNQRLEVDLTASITCDQSWVERLHILSTFGIIVLVQLLSLRGDADLGGSLLSSPVAVSACKVVTSDSGLWKLVRCTDTGNVAGCTHGFHGASVSAEHK